MRKYLSQATLLLFVLLSTALAPLPVGAQTPVSCSAEVQTLLQTFCEKPTVAAANRFFVQLDKEEFTEQKIQFPQGTPTDTLRAQVCYWAAEYHYAAQQYHEAEQYAEQALPLLENGGDQTTLTDCLNLLAITDLRLSHYDGAIAYARQCYELDVQSGDDERIASSLNTLAAICLSARQLQQAEEYVERALDYAEKTGIDYRLATVQGMAAEVFHATGNDERALDYAEQAYQTEQRLERPHKAMIRLSQKAAALIGLHRYEEAEEALATAIPFFREQGQPMRQSLAICCNKMGEVCMATERIAEATRWYREGAALFSELGDQRGEMHSRQGLYQSLWDSHPDSARIELNLFNQLRDSVYNLASAESLARYNAEFGNDFLRKENQAERTARQRVLLAAVGLVAVLVVVMLLGYLRMRRRQAEQIRRLVEQIEAMRTSTDEQEQTSYSDADTDFLQKTTALVHQLMPRGEADIAHVASELCISPSKFSREVKRITGHTAAQYIMAIRMDEAKRLLSLHPQPSINDIAQRCGFTDHPHFTNTFRRLYGITPKQYSSA